MNKERASLKRDMSHPTFNLCYTSINTWLRMSYHCSKIHVLYFKESFHIVIGKENFKFDFDGVKMYALDKDSYVDGSDTNVDLIY